MVEKLLDLCAITRESQGVFCQIKSDLFVNWVDIEICSPCSVRRNRPPSTRSSQHQSLFYTHGCGLETSCSASWQFVPLDEQSWKLKIHLQMDRMGFQLVFLWIYHRDPLDDITKPWCHPIFEDPRVQHSLWSTVRFAGVSDAVLQKARKTLRSCGKPSSLGRSNLVPIIGPPQKIWKESKIIKEIEQ